MKNIKGWTAERETGAAARSEWFLNNFKHVLLCIFLHASAGEVKEKEGRREGRGGQQQQQDEEEEEEERFDAMQTGSLKHAARSSPYATKAMV